MKKIFFSLACLLFAAPVFAGSAVNGLNSWGNVKVSKPSRASAVINAPKQTGQTRTKKAVKDWTIMVFINGKNSLSEDLFRDLNEMEAIGSSKNVNIVAELGMAGEEYSVKRYEVKKDTDIYELSSPVVQDLKSVNMADWQELAAFGKWAKENYPARHYMLIIESHGSGWKDNKRKVVRGISSDDEYDEEMSTPNLAKGIAAMGGVDVYGSDACLMQMAEVIYELKDVAKYIMGSEESEPGAGNNYTIAFGNFVVKARRGLTPMQAAKTIVDAYAQAYSMDTNEDITQSAVRTSAARGLAKMINSFASAIMARNDRKSLEKALSAALVFDTWSSHSRDLVHIARIVRDNTEYSDVARSADRLISYVNNDLLVVNRTQNKAKYSVDEDYNANAGGVAIMFTTIEPDQDYFDLAWAKDTKWLEMLAWFNGW